MERILPKRNFAISVLAVFAQYYDYHLFGFLATNIAFYFFPPNQEITQLLNTYFLMTVAMIAKPVGSLILGKIGDIHGRSNSFKISLFGAAIASIIISLIPSYASIGILATIILLICRMIVCALVTPGSDGVRIYVYEHMAESNKCLGVGIVTVFTLIGSLIASISASFFANEQFEHGWKLSFFIGAIFGFGVILAMQLAKFSDKTVIKKHVDYDKYKNMSIKKIIRENFLLFISCTILAGAIGSTNQFLIIFFGTYNFGILKIIDRSDMQSYISIAIIAYMIFSIIGGYISDKFNKFYIILIASILAVVESILLSISINNMVFNHYLYIAIASTIPFITMPSAVILKESVPISIRYRLFSLSHAIGSVVISAPTSYFSTLLYYKTGIIWLPILYFIFTIFIISFAVYNLFGKNQIYKKSLQARA